MKKEELRVVEYWSNRPALRDVDETSRPKQKSRTMGYFHRWIVRTDESGIETAHGVVEDYHTGRMHDPQAEELRFLSNKEFTFYQIHGKLPTEKELEESPLGF